VRRLIVRRYLRLPLVLAVLAAAFLVALVLLLAFGRSAGLYDFLMRLAYLTVIFALVPVILYLVFWIAAIGVALPTLGVFLVGNALHRHGIRQARWITPRPVDEPVTNFVRSLFGRSERTKPPPSGNSSAD
jgi:fatty acid desaturase